MVCYLSTFFSGFALNLLPNERRIWLRDYDVHLYYSLEYFLSVVLCELPKDILSASIFSTICYFLMGFAADAGKFFLFLAVNVLNAIVLSGLCSILGAIAPSGLLAAIVFGIVLLFVTLTNGFFILYNTIPSWYKWIADVNYQRFATTALYINEFGGQFYNCTNCTFSSGDQVLSSLAISPSDTVQSYVVFLLICFGVFHFLAWLAVTFFYTGLLGTWQDRFRIWRSRCKEDSGAV